MPKKPNVILLTIDALRADYCGFVNKEALNLTPNLNAFSKECAVFERAFSVGPTSTFSFPGILTSTYPLDFEKDPSLPQRTIEPPRKLLSEVLKENGYTTAAFHASIVNSEFFGYNRGWDYFEYLSAPQFLTPSFSPGGKMRLKNKIVSLLRSVLLAIRSLLYSSYPKIFLFAKYSFYKRRKQFPEWVNDSRINDLGSGFISAQDEDGARPFFLWLHYMNVHIPYYSSEGHPPGDVMGFEEFLGRYAPDNFQNSISSPAVRRLAERHVDSTRKFYGERVSAADRKAGFFLKMLKERGLYDDALIVLTADHGDEFMEHGGLTHSSKLYNELLYVPLLIKFPQGKFERITKKVSLIDLPTTVCDIVGADRPKTYRGGNLLSDVREFVVHQASFIDNGVWGIMLACQNDDWKYILTTTARFAGEAKWAERVSSERPQEVEELYNLKRDPQEKNNLVARERGVAAKMRSVLKTTSPL